MPSRKQSSYELKSAGDRALLVDFGGPISEETDLRVAAFVRALRARRVQGLLAIQPAYTSVLLKFDPQALGPDSLARALPAPSTLELEAPSVRQHVIPVCYEGPLAPDLGEVARLTGLSRRRVIELHVSVTYRVSFLGFLPGFGYLGGLPEALRVPRHAEPKLKVPAGSVGLADLQTGVYPLDSPGGWRIIGRTPVALLDWKTDPPTLLSPGDRVRFEPVSLADFERLGGRWEP